MQEGVRDTQPLRRHVCLAADTGAGRSFSSQRIALSARPDVVSSRLEQIPGVSKATTSLLDCTKAESNCIWSFTFARDASVAMIPTLSLDSSGVLSHPSPQVTMTH